MANNISAHLECLSSPWKHSWKEAHSIILHLFKKFAVYSIMKTIVALDSHPSQPVENIHEDSEGAPTATTFSGSGFNVSTIGHSCNNLVRLRASQWESLVIGLSHLHVSWRQLPPNTKFPKTWISWWIYSYSTQYRCIRHLPQDLWSSGSFKAWRMTVTRRGHLSMNPMYVHARKVISRL